MTRGTKVVFALEALGLFALAMIVRLVDIDSALGGNEIFHMLAARSWVEEGTFRVAHGFYARNAEFTAFLSWLMQIGGETARVARMPSLTPEQISSWDTVPMFCLELKSMKASQSFIAWQISSFKMRPCDSCQAISMSNRDCLQRQTPRMHSTPGTKAVSAVGFQEGKNIGRASLPNQSS